MNLFLLKIYSYGCIWYIHDLLSHFLYVYTQRGTHRHSHRHDNWEPPQGLIYVLLMETLSESIYARPREGEGAINPKVTHSGACFFAAW